jgi:hypothetical protein
MTLAGDLKASIAEYTAQVGDWPPDMAALGLGSGGTTKTGRYVLAVDVDAGTINIQYGKDANVAIQAPNGDMLSFRPLVNANQDIVWVCGNADDPTGAIDTPSGGTASGANATTLVDKYVPSSCRTGFGGA